MNRLTAKLVQGFSRLAFWRKPAAAFLEQPETPAAEASTGAQPEAEPAAAADTAEPQVGRFERLKQRLNLGRKRIAEQPVALDPASLAEAPARELADENAIGEAASAPKLSVLARLKTTFRRQTKAQALEADESIPGAGQDRDAAAFSEDESDSDEDTAQPGRIRRALATLSNKWVWIPGASAMLLVLIGAMALMLLQSAQEKQHLQAELLATQKKLEQTGVAKAVAADTDVPAPAPAFAAVGSAAAGSHPGIDAGDCQVSDQASVSQNLKNCIDSFNRSMAGSR